MEKNAEERNLLTLYYDDVSPPVRSCLMLIKMLNLDVQLKYLNLFKGEQFKAEFVELNPMHTVPTLVHGELVLTDSHVILIYLAEHYQQDRDLLPKNDLKRMRVLNILFFESSVLFRRDSDMMSEIVRKGFDQTDIGVHKRKIKETYNVLEKHLQKHLYLATDELTLADISIIGTLSTVNLMFPINKNEFPLMSAWLERMKSLPEYEINRIGLDKLRQTIEEIGKFTFSTASLNI